MADLPNDCRITLRDFHGMDNSLGIICYKIVIQSTAFGKNEKSPGDLVIDFALGEP